MEKKPAFSDEECAHAACVAVSSVCRVLGVSPWDRWEDMPKENHQNLASMVRMIRSMNGDYTTEYAHEAWVERSLSRGWTRGEKHDEAAKTHPYLVPFDELPWPVRVREAVFVAVVRAI